MGTAPLRRKLNSIALITTGVALLLTTLLFFVGEVIAIRRSSLQELRILSEVVASNSSAALAFDNPDDARAVLAAFRADPHIVAAALFKPDGQLFVSYPESPAAIAAMPVDAGYRIDGAALIGVAPVREDARILGTLYVRSDLSAVYDRVMFYTLVALLVIGLALLVAWAIARRLQRQLSAPSSSWRVPRAGCPTVTTTGCAPRPWASMSWTISPMPSTTCWARSS